MNQHRNWFITQALLKLLKALEDKNKALDSQGVKILQLEYLQMDVIHTILDVNKVSRDHTAVDWLCHPLFQMMWGEIEMAACMNILQDRIAELKRPGVQG